MMPKSMWLMRNTTLESFLKAVKAVKAFEGVHPPGT